jgi:hypothetical protein
MVIVALYPIVKESFQTYHDMTNILGIFIDRFTEMEVPECYKVYDVFCRVGKQYDELDLFYSWSKSIGIGRSSEYPEIEKVTTKKLDLMDQFIRDKSLLSQANKQITQEENNEKNEEENEVEEDMNEIKALPPPEGFNEEQVEEEIKEQDQKEEEKIVQTEGDLLDLTDDMTNQNYVGNKLALALFDELPSTTSNTTQALPWHAFDDVSDWETTLVQSSSNLPNQKPSLGGGFDTLLLDSMYNQKPSLQGMNGYGSASSVAIRSEATMLALPAPPTSRNGSQDPFAASMLVAPPAYVQMSEMETRQRLLAEEQAMWQQYAKSGMQGQVGFATQQQPNSNFYMGGYQQNHYGSYYH